MNKNLHPPSLAELERRRALSLMISQRAAAAHPDIYREIKTIIRRVLQGPVDIGDYFQTARKLSGLLEKLANADANSLFHYFANSIDPFKCGRAMYFRADCLDLAEQLKCIDEWRVRKHHVRVVQ